MLDVLKGKKVLIVDDEPDVCDMVREELASCDVEAVGTHAEARAKLATGKYDVVILDIMGVRGHELLEEFSSRFPCIVLTANALSPKDLERSIRGKARLYLPKEELARIDEYVARVLVAREPLWTWLFKQLDLERWFGRGGLGFDRDFFKGLVLTEEEVLKDVQHYDRHGAP